MKWNYRFPNNLRFIFIVGTKPINGDTKRRNCDNKKVKMFYLRYMICHPILSVVVNTRRCSQNIFKFNVRRWDFSIWLKYFLWNHYCKPVIWYTVCFLNQQLVHSLPISKIEIISKQDKSPTNLCAWIFLKIRFSDLL